MADAVVTTPDFDLPLELRVALDLIARETGGIDGKINAQLIGMHSLKTELSRYAQISLSSDILILLMAPADLADATMGSATANEVWTLSAGPLARILRPLRSAAGPGMTSVDLSSGQWRAHGFDRVAASGIQGLGSIAWAAGERICRRFDRPDLADRCRIGMLRTLVAARPVNLSTIMVTHYRRSAGV